MSRLAFVARCCAKALRCVPRLLKWVGWALVLWLVAEGLATRMPDRVSDLPFGMANRVNGLRQWIVRRGWIQSRGADCWWRRFALGKPVKSAEQHRRALWLANRCPGSVSPIEYDPEYLAAMERLAEAAEAARLARLAEEAREKLPWYDPVKYGWEVPELPPVPDFARGFASGMLGWLVVWLFQRLLERRARKRLERQQAQDEEREAIELNTRIQAAMGDGSKDKEGFVESSPWYTDQPSPSVFMLVRMEGSKVKITGHGFRLGDALVTPLHCLVYAGTEGRVVTMDWPTKQYKKCLPVGLLDWTYYEEEDIAMAPVGVLAELPALRPSPLMDGMNMQAQIRTYMSDQNCSNGSVSKDPNFYGRVNYSGSTRAGFSGAPYMCGNKTVYGMHMSGGLRNWGLAATMLSLRAQRLEASDDWTRDLVEWMASGKRARRKMVAPDEWEFELGDGRYLRVPVDDYATFLEHNPGYRDWEDRYNDLEDVDVSGFDDVEGDKPSIPQGDEPPPAGPSAIISAPEPGNAVGPQESGALLDVEKVTLHQLLNHMLRSVTYAAIPVLQTLVGPTGALTQLAAASNGTRKELTNAAAELDRAYQSILSVSQRVTSRITQLDSELKSFERSGAPRKKKSSKKQSTDSTGGDLPDSEPSPITPPMPTHLGGPDLK